MKILRCRLGILAATTFLLLSMPSHGQNYDLLVIEDSVRSSVDRSDSAATQQWWLVQWGSARGTAVPVVVTHHEPYCTKTVEPCIDGEWSQRVDVRAIEDPDTALPPPHYLVDGPIDPALTRTAQMNGRFDPSSRESTISVFLGTESYRVTRTRTADDSRIAVTLSVGSVAQALYACETGGESYPFCGDEGFEEILWSGDLDGDDRLDLIAQFTPKYSMRNYYLFISSGASAGQHVRVAAQFSRVAD